MNGTSGFEKHGLDESAFSEKDGSGSGGFKTFDAFRTSSQSTKSNWNALERALLARMRINAITFQLTYTGQRKPRRHIPDAAPLGASLQYS